MSSTTSRPAFAGDPMQAAIARWVDCGYAVESQTPTMSVVTKGKKPNHVLHLLLSVVTLGLWLPVWLCLAIFKRPRRMMLRLMDDGTVTESKA